jgi:hypothetical protein
VQIPICWLSQPVTLRMDPPWTEAEVSVSSGGMPGRAADPAAVAEYGSNTFTATLTTAIAADATNLATWKVTHQAEPRVRSPQLTVNLMHRTDTERQLLLGIARNRRIQITGVPPEFPEGAASLVVAGISHELSLSARLIRITTRPVIGTTSGVPGPWFRLATSELGGSDLVPF